MAEQRIKGQEVSILLALDGQIQTAFQDVRSFEVSVQLEILSEGYLGETSKRRDDIYHGISGSMELHYERAEVFLFIQQLVDRARRRGAATGSRVIIKASLMMPNGQRPRIVIENPAFGEIPLSFGSRSDFGSIKLSFEAEDFAVTGI